MSISYVWSVWLVFIITIFLVEISEFIANSVDPDQTLHTVASDLGLHCLPMSLLWDAWHKWVKIFFCGLQSTGGCREKKDIAVETFLDLMTYPNLPSSTFKHPLTAIKVLIQYLNLLLYKTTY